MEVVLQLALPSPKQACFRKPHWWYVLKHSPSPNYYCYLSSPLVWGPQSWQAVIQPPHIPRVLQIQSHPMMPSIHPIWYSSTTTCKYCLLAGRGPMLCTAEMSPQYQLSYTDLHEKNYIMPFMIVSIFSQVHSFRLGWLTLPNLPSCKIIHKQIYCYYY